MPATIDGLSSVQEFGFLVGLINHERLVDCLNRLLYSDNSFDRLLMEQKSPATSADSLVIDCLLISLHYCCQYHSSPDNNNNKPPTQNCFSKFLLDFIGYFADVGRYLACNKQFETSSEQCQSVIDLLQQQLYQSMNNHSLKSPLRNDQMLKVFRILSRCNPLAQYMVRQAGIKPLLKRLMLECQQDCLVQIECCAIVANLASSGRLRKECFAGSEFLPLILVNMKRFNDRPEIATEICAALSNLSLSDEMAKEVVLQGGMEMLMDLCQATAISGGGKNQTELLTQAMHVLANLVGNGEPKHRQSTQLLDTIYSAAIKYDYCVELMTAVNNLLGSMAFSGYKFTFHQSDHLTTLLVCGMRRFSDNVTLMITSCFAIAHMSFGKDSFRFHSGLDCILEAMDRFKLNHSLQTTACFALGSLISGNDDIRRQIMENGGIMRILNAITRQYPPNQQSVLSAGRRLKQVVTTFDDHQFTTDYDDDTAENDENAGDDDDVDDESESREVIDPETVNDYEDDENSGDDDASSIDQISGGPLSATIRGGKQAAGKGQSLTRSLLLQLFGCVALFNMSENDECDKQLRQLGVWRYVFEAATRVADIPQLYCVLYTIFIQLTSFLDPAIYLSPLDCGRGTSIQSLSDLCLQTIAIERRRKQSLRTGLKADQVEDKEGLLANALSGLSRLRLTRRLSFFQMHFPRDGEDSPSTTSTGYTTNCPSSPDMNHRDSVATITTKLDEPDTAENIFDREELPKHLLYRLEQLQWCHACGERPCSDIGLCITYYELSTKQQICRRICSEECAMNFDERLRKGDRHIHRVQWARLD